MISVLAQERLLGAVLGSAITGIVVFEQRKFIYNSISGTQSQVDSNSQCALVFYTQNQMILINRITRLGNQLKYASHKEIGYVEAAWIAREPIFPKKTRSDFAHLWNKAVDQTFGPLIESVSSRRW
ncbi:hypothetical protein EZV62_002433 [Acer yangbiense]|uniref:Uncharacterized protein n=1 Tax=Acer yangbiense TaxID=1000413 RepID=A0A5C7IY99_9ROSI|nr:hypothetical protein EZV62_002433 [Acer yangbiense]